MASETQKIYVQSNVVGQLNGGNGGIPTGASGFQSVLNLCKVCIGTGALALPFAFKEGGLLFGSVGLVGIAAWNYYASCRIDALRLHTAENSYASLAEHVFGSASARRVVDVCTISTLTGVCVVYTLTFATLLHDTPLALSPGGDATSPSREILLFGLLVLPLCVTPHMKFLANSSAVGLLALVLGFGAIFDYGFSSSVGGACAASASLAPHDLSQFSSWFGVAAFSFGVPPLQFSLQDAMAQPRDFTGSLKTALVLVWAMYTLSGVGIAYLYRCQTMQENILLNLPEGSAFATGLRLSYAVVCITSYPLALVPVTDMVSELVGPNPCASPVAAAPCRGVRRGFDALPSETTTTIALDGGSTTNGGSSSSSGHSSSSGNSGTIIPLRLCMLGLSTVASLLFPHFGLIVSVIGSFSVTLVSFVLPSAMCLVCARDESGHTAASGRPWLGKHFSGFEAQRGPWQWWVDAASFVFGLVACLGVTFITVASAM